MKLQDTNGVGNLIDHTRYQKVFITGAMGFVGWALASAYRQLGAQVVGLDVRADDSANVIAGDVAEPAAWQDQMQGSDLVIHTAALVTNNVSKTVAWWVNALGTRRVLVAARQAGVRRFVYISSLAAMRFVDKPQADETAAVMPTGNPYVDSKIAAEHAVLAAHSAGELECTVIRPADVYGPGSRPWTIVPVQMIRKGLFLLPMHGQGLFRALYIDDLVAGILLAAEKDEAAGQIFILGGEKPLTTAQFFGHYYRMLGKGDRPRTFSSPVAIAIAETGRFLFRLMGRPTELGRGAMEMLSKKNTVSNEKAHRLLGWQPEVDLDEGMRHTEVWLRAQGMLD